AIEQPAGQGLVANKVNPGHFTATLRPWFLNRWLAAAALLPSLALLGVYGFMRRRQFLSRDPQRVHRSEAEREVQTQLGIMQGAAASGAAAEFFAAVRTALQHQLSIRWGLRPETITSAEMITLMNGEAEGFRFVLDLADEATYMGRTFAAAELQKLCTVINAEIKKLETR